MPNFKEKRESLNGNFTSNRRAFINCTLNIYKQFENYTLKSCTTN